MAISASFHRNVFLLTQIIEPSDEFKKHFREGMFDKPNTAGFLYVSHYLLTIYDSERFHKLVEWPVICKKTEAKYRNNIKDYLITLATENSDIGFPTILTSHLIHAGGNKFTIIMWKLSQIVLRKYITRGNTYDVMFAPRIITEDGLEKKFLSGNIATIDSRLSDIHKNISEMEKTVKTAFEEEKESLANIRTQIFEKEESVSILSREAPVHDTIKKRLIDIHDEEVIQMWKKNVDEGMNYISKKNIVLKDIKELSDKISNIISGSCTDTNMLDGNQLQKINYVEISEALPYMQCLLFQLYKNDKLVLNKFLLLFNSLITQLYQQFKLNSVEDFTECSLQIKASCIDAKTALDIFQTSLSNIKTLIETQNMLCQKNITQIYDNTMLPVMNDVLLMSSPLMRIDTDYSNVESDLKKRLELTPVEAAHKSLFSRYERLKQDQISHESKLRENFLVSRMNLNDTISNINSEKPFLLTRMTSSAKKLAPFKQAEKYSQLFSSRMRRNRAALTCSTAYSSMMSLPSSSKANSTAITNAPEEMHNISELTLNISVKSLCNNSMEFGTPEKLSVKQENKSDNTSETEDVVNALPNKPIVLDICTTLEVEIADNCDNRTVESEQMVKNRRRSIGDLVERYKKILERSNRTPSPNSINVKHNNEKLNN
ncbi:uncharacterized protein LOC143185812 [Calliopsis andreniformis]|uniref:uncharacterized protein LOC143185812 n=1 Tax=Calliopsis andreniformis TaxID=337506 RepID=UPI003FCCC0E3